MSEDGPKPRVLLVEDDGAVREHLASTLADEFDIETAGDGEQALVAVLRRRPDLIVTDMVMPTLDGVELVRLLRETPSTSTIPILLTSGVAQEDLRIAGFELGADSYLAKPYSSRELRARLRAMEQSSRRRNEIAQQEALERATAERASLLESITDAFFAVDDDWRFTYVNHRALEFFEKALADLLGKELWVVVGRTGGVFESELELAMTGQSQTSFEARWTDGRWLEVHVFPNSKGLAINFRDVTERRAAEESMKEGERRKDEFVATLAHELRNPLAPIRNGINVLRKRFPNSADAEQVLSMMERQMGHMVRLLDDLLDVSRITRGRLELQREVVAMSTILSAAVEATSAMFESRSQMLSVELGDYELHVDGDVTRLVQVFTNLLSNSAKYTPAGGRVTVTVSKSKEDALIAIEDTGIGIPTDSLEHVFEMFSQVRIAQKQDEPGLGIGLSVVRNLVQMHGGSVLVASEGEGKGSIFFVRLPLVASSPREEPSPTERVRAFARKERPLRILVVDDNQDSALSMATMLELENHVVRTAFSGQEAIASAEAFRPDLILMDIGMPDMDGFETTHRIRCRGTVPRPAIVALTGWGQEADRVRSRAAGMDEHLVKPVDPDTLRVVIASMEWRPRVNSPTNQ